MRNSFGEHESLPGEIWLREDMPSWIRDDLANRGYTIETRERTSGPINAVYFDREHGTFWGGSSDYGEDYGLAW